MLHILPVIATTVLNLGTSLKIKTENQAKKKKNKKPHKYKTVIFNNYIGLISTVATMTHQASFNLIAIYLQLFFYKTMWIKY